MSLMDKFKNLFTDEEIIEEEEPVKIRQVKKEEEEDNKLPTFMREKIEREEQDKKKTSPQLDLSLNHDSEKSDNVFSNNISLDEHSNKVNVEEEINKFKFPIELEDSDFIETRSRSNRQNTSRNREEKKEVKKSESFTKKNSNNIKKETKVADLYKNKKNEKIDEKKFKATPIISPVYGILDKNYQADDVEENLKDNFDRQRPSKNVDFDSVRKKAYGSLAEDIKENLICENCEYLKEAKECHEKNESFKDDGLMYDILNDSDKENSTDITLADATENYYDYGVEYSPISTSDNYIDEKKDIVINDCNDAPIENNRIKEVPPVKSKINLLSTLKKSAGDVSDSVSSNDSLEQKDLELTDDLFSLIDSMYEERNDR